MISGAQMKKPVVALSGPVSIFCFLSTVLYHLAYFFIYRMRYFPGELLIQ